MKRGRRSISTKIKKISTGFSLSPTALRILDRLRGEETRSACVEKLIREKVK